MIDVFVTQNAESAAEVESNLAKLRLDVGKDDPLKKGSTKEGAESGVGLRLGGQEMEDSDDQPEDMDEGGCALYQISVIDLSYLQSKPSSWKPTCSRIF